MMDGEVVGYPLQRLVGRVVGAAPSETEGFIQAQVGEQPRDGEDDEESGRWVVAGGRFKALVLLGRGDNTIRLRYAPSNGEASRSISLELRVHYEPLLIDNRFARQCQAIVTPAMLAGSASSGTDDEDDDEDEEKEGKESWRHFVRLIYLVARDDVVGEEGSLDEEAVRTNVARLGLGALMLQAFCAQNLDEDGRAMDHLLPFPLGQATFGLEFDFTRPERNWPVVHVVRSRCAPHDTRHDTRTTHMTCSRANKTRRLTREEIYRLGNNWRDGGQSAWGHFASELRGLPHRNK
jgi:hypothetical protein